MERWGTLYVDELGVIVKRSRQPIGVRAPGYPIHVDKVTYKSARAGMRFIESTGEVKP